VQAISKRFAQVWGMSCEGWLRLGMTLRASLKILLAGLGGAAIIAGAPAAKADDNTAKKWSNDTTPFFTRKDSLTDGSSALTYGTKLPNDFDTKVGVDFGVAAAPIAPDPDKLINRSRGNGNSGAAWATIAVPATPFGMDEPSLDAKYNSADDHGKFGVGLSRKLPLNDDFSMTLKNRYDVTSALPTPASPGAQSVSSGLTQTWETKRVLQFDLLRTETAISAGEQMTSNEEKWLRSVSAEQKIYGPLSITGGISETTTGVLDRSIKAGFKKTW
jgi:hypothetical protein